MEWVDIETGEKLTPNPEGYYIVKTIKKMNMNSEKEKEQEDLQTWLEKPINKEDSGKLSIIQMTGTPFSLVWTDGGWKMVMGNSLMTPTTFTTADRAYEWLKENQWNVIFGMVAKLTSEADEIKKFVEKEKKSNS